MFAKISLLVELFSLLICIGNFAKRHCGAALSWSDIVGKALENAKLPVKFPDSREFIRRRVRSALRRQPASPAFGLKIPDTCRKARQQRAFAVRRLVSVLPISRHRDRIRRKSLTNTANIPVFGRHRPETGFDHGLRGGRTESSNPSGSASKLWRLYLPGRNDRRNPSFFAGENWSSLAK
jgi:hypothetical protein